MYHQTVPSATLRQPVTIAGRGMFNGRPCSCTVKPAPYGTGLVFIRAGVRIPAVAANYLDLPNCSALSAEGQVVKVTEHLLAALWAAGVTDALIEMSGEEAPNLDGSAYPMYAALEAGGVQQHGLRQEFSPAREFYLQAGPDAFVIARPADRLLVEFTFDHRELGVQKLRVHLTRERVATGILSARTFITESEAQAARDAGVLQHEDESAALLVRSGRPVRPLRFRDEYVRHKVLDLVGDLAVLPFELRAHITAHRSGHQLNRALARRLAQEYAQAQG